MHYSSGLRVTLSLSDKSLTVVEYEHGPSMKKSMGDKWNQACADEKKGIKSQSEIDLYLRNNK